MELAPKPPRRRVWSIVLSLLGLVVLSLVAVFLEAWISAGRLLDREREKLALRKEGDGSIDSIRPHPFEPAEDGNAWTELQKSFAAFDAIPYADYDILPRLSGDESPKIDDEAIGALMARLKPAFDGLRVALSQRRIQIQANDPAGQSTASGIIRSARVIGDGASHLHRKGNDALALEYLAMGFAAGSLKSPSGALVDELVRMVVEGTHFPVVKEILASHNLTADQLRVFGSDLDNLLDSQTGFSEAWREESWGMRRIILNEANTCTERRDRWHYKCLPYRMRRAKCLQWIEVVISENERLARLNPWSRRVESEKAAGRLDKAPKVVAQWADSCMRAWHNNTINLQQRTLMRVAVAVAHYEAMNGAFPLSLARLTPDYLPRMPSHRGRERTMTTDPWSGKSLKYKIQGDTALVYSEGGDGDDDGGRPVKDDTDMDEEGDIVWTVKRRGAGAK